MSGKLPKPTGDADAIDDWESKAEAAVGEIYLLVKVIKGCTSEARKMTLLKCGGY